MVCKPTHQNSLPKQVLSLMAVAFTFSESDLYLFSAIMTYFTYQIPILQIDL